MSYILIQFILKERQRQVDYSKAIIFYDQALRLGPLRAVMFVKIIIRKYLEIYIQTFPLQINKRFGMALFISLETVTRTMITW